MNYFIYAGTYTDLGRGQGHRSEGIYCFLYHPSDGRWEPLGATLDTLNPSFLAIHPSGRYLYAVNELWEGAISAFAIQPQDGKLIFLNSQLTAGAHPCYVSCDPGGRWVMVANYSSGSLAVFPVLPDGSLGERSGFVQHSGALGPNRNRQERPHAHSIRFDPSGRFVLAADLGLDQIRVYHLNEQGELVPSDPPGCAMSPGAGPRHFEFSPNARYVYIANELDSTVTACAWDSQLGVLTPFQTLSTLPPGFEAPSTVADIHCTPDGAWLYVSNRGHDSLAIFAIDPHTGRLEARQHAPTLGKTPRNFALDPLGKFLFVANQDSDTIIAYRLNALDGSLTPTGQVISTPKPVCIAFAPVEGD